MGGDDFPRQGASLRARRRGEPERVGCMVAIYKDRRAEDCPPYLSPARTAVNLGLRDSRIVGFADETAASWSAPAERERRRRFRTGDEDGTINPSRACESGVALRLPPQSKTRQPQRGDIFVDRAMKRNSSSVRSGICRPDGAGEFGGVGGYKDFAPPELVGRVTPCAPSW